MATLPTLPIVLNDIPGARRCYDVLVKMPAELRRKGERAFINVCANSTTQARSIAKREGYEVEQVYPPSN